MRVLLEKGGAKCANGAMVPRNEAISSTANQIETLVTNHHFKFRMKLLNPDHVKRSLDGNRSQAEGSENLSVDIG